MNFTFYAPSRIVFGTLNVNSIVDELLQYGRKIMVLSGGNSTSKIASNIVDNMAGKLEVSFIDGIKSNPLDTFIETVLESYDKPDAIVTVGGGSVHDTGKALAVLFTHQGNVCDYMTDGKFSVPGIKSHTIPLITVPTIFGTGAEISPAALIRVGAKKKVMFSPYLFPKTSYVDSSLALSTPVSMCVNTALDAFVQGIESFVSTKSQDFSRNFSKIAILRVLNTLPDIAKGKVTNAQMEQIALASIEGMYAVTQSSVGAVHAISDPLSGIYNVHHGEAVAALLPIVAEANYKYAATLYDEIRDLINTTLSTNAANIRESIEAFYNIIGFEVGSTRNNLLSSGIIDNLRQCVDDSFNGDMDGNPFVMNVDDVNVVLRQFLEIGDDVRA